MKEIIANLREISSILNWQVTTLIILVMVRRHLGLLFSGVYGLLNRTTKVVVDGKSVTVEAEAAKIIEKQNQVIEKEQKEKHDLKKELNDYAQGATQTLPKKVLVDNLERLQPVLKTMGIEHILDANKETESEHPADPEKGRWGGLSINNEKRLSATVVPIENNSTLFKVMLIVASTNSAKPLIGKVTFHLHPTFIKPVRTMLAENGIAQLHLMAYGAFTVGVMTEDGTKLELDLAEDRSFPEVFREN
ncbi:MAG: pYEATS domain-containing protein [Saprospiraceae bacterium]